MASIGQCHSYGRKIAERFRDLPNVIWMSGGDYIPATKDLARGSDVDLERLRVGRDFTIEASRR